MKSAYFDTGIAAVAVNLKAGSASIARAIIAAHHPAVEAAIQAAAYPAGKGPENTRWQGICPKVAPADRAHVLMAVRDPVERFRSACAERGVDVDTILDSLEADWGRDPHFWPQARLVVDGCKVYRFEDQLNDFAADAGLAWPLPNIHSSEGTKPALTDAQEARVLALYADDQQLYDSIEEAGQVVSVPPAPVTDEAKATLRQRAAERRYAVETGGIEVGGVAVRTGREDQAMLAGAFAFTQQNPEATISWKGTDGFVELTASELAAIAQAVGAHVQACFAQEAALVWLIEAAETAAELAAIAQDVEAFALS
jgi:hypothetical protein